MQNACALHLLRLVQKKRSGRATVSIRALIAGVTNSYRAVSDYGVIGLWLDKQTRSHVIYYRRNRMTLQIREPNSS
jgi:hypothetical protein